MASCWLVSVLSANQISGLETFVNEHGFQHGQFFAVTIVQLLNIYIIIFYIFRVPCKQSYEFHGIVYNVSAQEMLCYVLIHINIYFTCTMYSDPTDNIFILVNVVATSSTRMYYWTATYFLSIGWKTFNGVWRMACVWLVTLLHEYSV